MKKTRQTGKTRAAKPATGIRALLFASFCCLAFAACESSEDGIVPSEGETTSVTLRIGTGNSVPGITTRYVDASQYEGIRTLRVIVTTGTPENRTILYNQKQTGITGGNSETETVTIPDVPLGEAMFYVIANEESLGKEYTDDVINADLADNRKVLFVDEENNRHFPKLGPQIVDDGLPMTGSKEVTVSKDMSGVDIELERAVVKLSLTVENATTSDITLKSVKFGPFSGDRFYLFPTYQLDVPDGSKYEGLSYDNQNIVIKGGGKTEKLSAYIYPTYAYVAGSENPYTISLSTSVRDYGKLVFAPNVNSFRRNTQVNIRARITTAVGIIVNFEVNDWDDYTVDVPSFN